MDPERELRDELVSLLGCNFYCIQEAALRHGQFSRHVIRADVLAFPLDSDFFDVPIAFEIKSLKRGRESHYAEWAPAIKQASDYVYARIEDGRVGGFVGRRVVASFVYPAPPWGVEPGALIGRVANHQLIVSGAFHAALYFRVGRARKDKKGALELSFGPNPIWQSGRWTGAARDFLRKKRKIGSQMVDVLAELDGTGSRSDGMPWE
ncbi:MAG: hypothetical protein AB7E70_01370 [Hyphomicrobiaceae bacterium]